MIINNKNASTSQQISGDLHTRWSYLVLSGVYNIVSEHLHWSARKVRKHSLSHGIKWIINWNYMAPKVCPCHSNTTYISHLGTEIQRLTACDDFILWGLPMESSI